MLTNSLISSMVQNAHSLHNIDQSKNRFPIHKNIYLILLQVEEDKIFKMSNKNLQPFLNDHQIQQNSCI